MSKSPIQSELEIVHLIYHRHKNQHSNLYWWTHFALLHRKCKRIDTLYIENKEKHKRQISDLCHYLVSKIIPKLYYSVQSELARDQFVTLYLLVIACAGKLSADLSKLVIPSESKAHSNSLHDTAKDTPLDTRSTSQHNPAERVLDLGELVNRDDLKRNRPPTSTPAIEKTDKRASLPKKDPSPSLKKEERPRKKKKKNSSAIDDIFGF